MTRVPIGDLIEHEIGGGWGRAEPTEQERETAAVIRGTDLPRVAVGETESVPRRFHRSGTLSKRMLRVNDIVFEVSGGSKDQPVGRSMLVSQRVLDALKNRVICASFCKLIRIDPDQADPRFVFRVLQLAYADGTLSRFCVQSTGITNFKWKPFLADYVVDLPSAETQRRVADVLGAIDDLIENNQRRVVLLEQMAQLIYREWFVHYRYPGHEDEELVESPLGPVPAGWEIEELSEVAWIVMGQSPSSEHYNDSGDGLPFHQGVSNLDRNFPRHVHYCPIEGRLAEAGDHLVSVRAPVGRINRADQRVVIGRGLAAIRSRGAFQSLLGQQLRTLFHDEDTMGAGTIFKAITKADLERLRLVQPTADASRFGEATLEPIDDLIRDLTFANRALESVRDLLLPRLVAGVIDVSQLDFDTLLEESAA